MTVFASRTFDLIPYFSLVRPCLSNAEPAPPRRNSDRRRARVVVFGRDFS